MWEEDPTSLLGSVNLAASLGLAVPTSALRVSSDMHAQEMGHLFFFLQIQQRVSLRNSFLLAWSMEGI